MARTKSWIALSVALLAGCYGSVDDGAGEADCVHGGLEVWLGEPLWLRYSGESAELDRDDRRAASLGGITVVYNDEPYEFLSIVRPAAAVEFVPLSLICDSPDAGQ